MLLLAVAAAEEHAAPLVMPNWAFALTAFIIFAVLGIITWSFRDVANRHSDRIHAGAGTGHATDRHAGH